MQLDRDCTEMLPRRHFPAVRLVGQLPADDGEMSWGDLAGKGGTSTIWKGTSPTEKIIGRFLSCDPERLVNRDG